MQDGLRGRLSGIAADRIARLQVHVYAQRFTYGPGSPASADGQQNKYSNAPESHGATSATVYSVRPCLVFFRLLPANGNRELPYRRGNRKNNQRQGRVCAAIQADRRGQVRSLSRGPLKIHALA